MREVTTTKFHLVDLVWDSLGGGIDEETKKQIKELREGKGMTVNQRGQERGWF